MGAMGNKQPKEAESKKQEVNLWVEADAEHAVDAMDLETVHEQWVERLMPNALSPRLTEMTTRVDCEEIMPNVTFLMPKPLPSRFLTKTNSASVRMSFRRFPQDDPFTVWEHCTQDEVGNVLNTNFRYAFSLNYYTVEFRVLRGIVEMALGDPFALTGGYDNILEKGSFDEDEEVAKNIVWGLCVEGLGYAPTNDLTEYKEMLPMLGFKRTMRNARKYGGLSLEDIDKISEFEPPGENAADEVRRLKMEETREFKWTVKPLEGSRWDGGIIDMVLTPAEAVNEIVELLRYAEKQPFSVWRPFITVEVAVAKSVKDLAISACISMKRKDLKRTGLLCKKAISMLVAQSNHADELDGGLIRIFYELSHEERDVFILSAMEQLDDLVRIYGQGGMEKWELSLKVKPIAEDCIKLIELVGLECARLGEVTLTLKKYDHVVKLSRSMTPQCVFDRPLPFGALLISKEERIRFAGPLEGKKTRDEFLDSLVSFPVDITIIKKQELENRASIVKWLTWLADFNRYLATYGDGSNGSHAQYAEKARSHYLRTFTEGKEEGVILGTPRVTAASAIPPLEQLQVYVNLAIYYASCERDYRSADARLQEALGVIEKCEKENWIEFHADSQRKLMASLIFRYTELFSSDYVILTIETGSVNSVALLGTQGQIWLRDKSSRSTNTPTRSQGGTTPPPESARISAPKSDDTLQQRLLSVCCTQRSKGKMDDYDASMKEQLRTAMMHVEEEKAPLVLFDGRLALKNVQESFAKKKEHSEKRVGIRLRTVVRIIIWINRSNRNTAVRLWLQHEIRHVACDGENLIYDQDESRDESASNTGGLFWTDYVEPVPVDPKCYLIACRVDRRKVAEFMEESADYEWLTERIETQFSPQTASLVEVKKARVEGIIPFPEMHHLLTGFDTVQSVPKNVYSFSLRQMIDEYCYSFFGINNQSREDRMKNPTHLRDLSPRRNPLVALTRGPR